MYAVYGWGKSEEGQTGRKSASDKLPVLVESLSGKGVQQVSAGYMHSLFLTGAISLDFDHRMGRIL
jgi:hypothetical protein